MPSSILVEVEVEVEVGVILLFWVDGWGGVALEWLEL